jgi:hypothetical protein
MRAHVLCKTSENSAELVEADTHNKLRRAHHSVNKKNTASTRLAILLAFVSNPHAIKQAPMKEEPRYPAGRVIHDMPPDMRVAPPSSAKHEVGGTVSLDQRELWVEQHTIKFDGVDMAAC